MRHQCKGRRLGRESSHRKAMMRNLVTSLLRHERVETTDARAKELRGPAEHIITLGKRGTLHARRQALDVIGDKEVVKKVFEEYAKRYKDRPGGYTRIIRLMPRTGDNSNMSVIELVTEPLKGAGKTRRRRRKAKVQPETSEAKKVTSKKKAAAEEEEAEKETAKNAVSEEAAAQETETGETPVEEKAESEEAGQEVAGAESEPVSEKEEDAGGEGETEPKDEKPPES